MSGQSCFCDSYAKRRLTFDEPYFVLNAELEGIPIKRLGLLSRQLKTPREADR
jgi:hypothetical protein